MWIILLILAIAGFQGLAMLVSREQARAVRCRDHPHGPRLGERRADFGIAKTS